jgi:hypothetical protein
MISETGIGEINEAKCNHDLVLKGNYYYCSKCKHKIKSTFLEALTNSSKSETELNKNTILTEANELIFGERQVAYGHPSKNYDTVSKLWTTYLHEKYKNSMGMQMVNVSAEDVCWMMVLLKMARQMNSSKRDNLVDAAGYIALIERLSE